MIDASALLAYLFDEPGAGIVEQALVEDPVMSAVNWAEILSRWVVAGAPLDDPRLTQLSQGSPAALRIVPFDDQQARETARIKQAAAGVLLSLADRACLALGRLHGLPVLTADRAWRPLKLKVKVVVIR